MSAPHFDKPRPSDFARWLTEQRLERKWRQSDVASRLGIHSGRISEWETGVKKPSDTMKRRLEQLFEKTSSK